MYNCSFSPIMVGTLTENNFHKKISSQVTLNKRKQSPPLFVASFYDKPVSMIFGTFFV